jgi:hypothetical protein
MIAIVDPRPSRRREWWAEAMPPLGQYLSRLHRLGQCSGMTPEVVGLRSMIGRLVQHYLASRQTHPIRWQFLDLAAGGAMVAFLWLLIGQTAGIAFAIFWAFLMVLGLVVLVAKWRHGQSTSG